LEIYGGTTFGHLPFPGVYTSYDYGAAISESREIGSAKYAELKRQAMFIRSSPEFYRTNIIGNSSKSSGVVHLYGGDEIDAFVTLLRNPDTGARFYIARHLNSISAYVIIPPFPVYVGL
jgi:Glycosyl hydrolases family 35